MWYSAGFIRIRLARSAAILLAATLTPHALARDRGDPIYNGCISIRSILLFADPRFEMSDRGRYDFGVGRVAIPDVTRSTLQQLEEKILLCNDIESRKIDRAYVHAKLEALWTRIRDIQLRPVQNDLSHFRGRLLDPPDLSRLNQIELSYPEMKGEVEALKAEQARLQSEKEENDRRVKQQLVDERKATEARTAYDVQLTAEEAELKRQSDAAADKEAVAAQLAKAAQAAKDAAFAATIPQICRDASKIQDKIKSPESQQGLQKAVTLAAAGDTAGACAYFTQMSAQVEEARSDLVVCSKSLETFKDPRAADLAQKALEMAVNLHSGQANLSQALEQMRCGD